MPSRQQSPSSSTASSSTKKAGHQRNPMACTNCRARKIKCDSNKRYPDHPCVRCVNRKLVCEYVAIAHTPSTDTRSRSGSFSSPMYPSPSIHDSNGKAHAASTMAPRYSPLSATYHPRHSRSDLYATNSYDSPPYASSNSSYSDSPGVENNVPSTLYNSYDSTNGTYMIHPGSHLSQMPNPSMNHRSPTPQYSGSYGSGMPGMGLPDPNAYYNRDPNYVGWHGLSMSTPTSSQGHYGAGCVFDFLINH
ncbi:hypothetical protein D9757_004180 [Collybiopsis confluens]|uniref:Zn(2)-C6 fungal-type domain-containing protein n=1 Tax=Collybiopsis confluens TaxID=2823264 RepID=A0A8H5HU33_9AGAR|nr:hypothetical protein D9757_004180 [Collybiopsis confluens]